MFRRPSGVSQNGFTLIELMVVVAIIGIILAIAVPYYVSYKRTTCDRSANGDLTKVRVCIERIANELVDLDCSSLEAEVSLVNLAWLVGPFYGWSGTTKKCQVRLRLNNSNTEIQTCALAGSLPSTGMRYIYRQSFPAGADLPAIAGPCDGAEYGGRAATCYTTSMVHTGTCSLGEPSGSVDCGSLSNF